MWQSLERASEYAVHGRTVAASATGADTGWQVRTVAASATGAGAGWQVRTVATPAVDRVAFCAFAYGCYHACRGGRDSTAVTVLLRTVAASATGAGSGSPGYPLVYLSRRNPSVRPADSGLFQT